MSRTGDAEPIAQPIFHRLIHPVWERGSVWKIRYRKRHLINLQSKSQACPQPQAQPPKGPLIMHDGTSPTLRRRIVFGSVAVATAHRKPLLRHPDHMQITPSLSQYTWVVYPPKKGEK